MSYRPKIKPPLTVTDKVIEWISWIALIGCWVLVIINYSELPETIPVHYNIAGEADDFGKKSTLLTLPVVTTILFIGMTILNKYPHIFNYPSTLTKDNALLQYKYATRIVRFVKLAIVLTFGMLVFKTLQTVGGDTDGLGPWFLPVTLALIFIPIIYFMAKSIRVAKV